MNKLFLMLLISCMLSSCKHSYDQNKVNLKSTPRALIEMTDIQEKAFEALTILQTNTDEQNRIYSTYVHTQHAFCSADTTILLNQKEFHFYLEKFIALHAQNLSSDKQRQLANESVLADEKYSLVLCEADRTRDDYLNGLPMTGTWFISNILGRSDLILVWD